MIDLDTVRAVARDIATPGACYASALVDAGVVTSPEDYCLYFSPYDGQPLCLVGQVVNRLGVSPRADEWEGRAIDKIPAAQQMFTPDALNYLAVAQNGQDADWTHDWAKILDALA